MKNKKEIAILFKRLKDKEGVATRYSPVRVIVGYYDYDNNIFRDINGNLFNHMSRALEDGYGFGLRTNIRELHKLYDGKKPSDLIKKYFNKYKRTFFYYVADDDNYTNIQLVSENSLTHKKEIIYDNDFIYDNDIDDKVIDTKSLIHNINNKIIGQDDAIEDIVSVLWQKTHTNNKNNMLLVGPTGVGKTEIVKTISKELDLPLAIINIGDFIRNGSISEGIDSILIKLLIAAEGDIDRAEQGIVVMDDFDKLVHNDYYEGSTLEYIQDELLKLVEGRVVSLSLTDENNNPEVVNFNTSNISFIAIGDFNNLNNCQYNGYLGFKTKENNSSNFYNNITSDLLIRNGIRPNLMGRIPIIIPFKPVTEDVLIKIMSNPNYNALNEKIELLREAGITLKVNNIDEVKKKIAHIAINKNIGVRGLNSVLEKTFVKAMCEVSQSNGEYSELIIDEKTIDDPRKYVLKRRNS